MYSEDTTVATAQKLMLEILQTVHRICEENNITYFLDAGTLLGAIRHGGFIPWDDDADIAMPRKDYEKFLKIAPKYLPDDLFLQTRETDPAYKITYAKIRKQNTLLIQKNETGHESFQHGIFIDIFPFDYYKSEWFLRWMKWALTIRGKRNKYKKGTFKRSLVTLYTHYFLLIPIEISLAIHRFFASHKHYFANENYDYLTYALEYGVFCITKTKDILPVKLAKNVFEGSDFYLPANPHNYLTAMYGSNYMQLPPVEERQTHAKKIMLDI